MPRIRTRPKSTQNVENHEDEQHAAEEFTVCMGGERKTARTYTGKDALLVSTIAWVACIVVSKSYCRSPSRMMLKYSWDKCFGKS